MEIPPPPAPYNVISFLVNVISNPISFYENISMHLVNYHEFLCLTDSCTILVNPNFLTIISGLLCALLWHNKIPHISIFTAFNLITAYTHICIYISFTSIVCLFTSFLVSIACLITLDCLVIYFYIYKTFWHFHSTRESLNVISVNAKCSSIEEPLLSGDVDIEEACHKDSVSHYMLLFLHYSYLLSLHCL